MMSHGNLPGQSFWLKKILTWRAILFVSFAITITKMPSTCPHKCPEVVCRNLQNEYFTTDMKTSYKTVNQSTLKGKREALPKRSSPAGKKINGIFLPELLGFEIQICDEKDAQTATRMLPPRGPGWLQTDSHLVF